MRWVKINDEYLSTSGGYLSIWLRRKEECDFRGFEFEIKSDGSEIRVVKYSTNDIEWNKKIILQ